MKRLLASVLLCGLALAPCVHAGDVDARFHDIYSREWAWRLQQFPLLATSIGVHRYDDRIDEVDEARQQARLKYWDQVLKRLDALDNGALSAGNRVNYEIYRAQIENLAADTRFRQYQMPFNSDSAFWSELAFLPSQQKLDDAADYARYLQRLKQIPRYFRQQIVNMRAGLKRGFSVPRAVLDGRDGSIADVAQLTDPVDSGFYAPFKTLPGTIDKDQAAHLRRQARKVIVEEVIPAYAELLAFFRQDYVPHARTTLAAEALPDGEAYYRQQIREYTTLDLEPDAIHAIGLGEVAQLRGQMETLMRSTRFDGTLAQFLEFLRHDPRFYAGTPEALLMHAAWIAKRIDGKLPQFFGKLPREPYGVAPVPAAIAPYYTSGRYVPASGPHESGTFWVNTYDLKSRALYNLPALTLHEAVPGHHLQIALAAEQTGQPAFRRNGYISAFGEGWGLYAEYLGQEMGIYTTPYERFGYLTYQMWRACRLVVDTGIHHLGWTRDKALAYLRENTALSEHEIETEVDRYISWPGQALSYMLGERRILELRQQAEKALGKNFDLRAFHDAVLSLGSVPLPVLSDHIQAFIHARQAAASTAAATGMAVASSAPAASASAEPSNLQ